MKSSSFAYAYHHHHNHHANDITAQVTAWYIRRAVVYIAAVRKKNQGEEKRRPSPPYICKCRGVENSQ